MNLQQISSLITKAAKAVEANEQVALPIMAAKARREAQANPTDVPLINASQVLTKMAEDKTFISKTELRGIVDRFQASHSKLSQVFSEELGKQAEVKPKTFQRYADEGTSLDRDYAKFSDPILSNALSGAFAKDPTEQLYSTADAQRAQRAAHAQLLALGFEPKELKTFAGRKDIIIVQAVHETPMGVANVLIPVEIREGRAVLPEMFFGRKGFMDLEKSAYISNVKSVAGKAMRVDGSKLLDILHQVKTGGDDGIYDVQLAAVKVASELRPGTPAIDNNSILYAQLDNETPDVQLPKMASTEESKFAETLGKPDGVARFVHGDRVVEAGRAMLVRKFAEIGYGSVQIKVADVEQDKVFYAVAIGTGTGLKVPVEVVGNLVTPPKVVFADGIVTAFSKEAISEVVRSGTGGNRRALAVASPCYDMKPSELVDVVKESIAEGNYKRAEEAINVLGEVDPHAQRVAIAHMMMNIGEMGKEPLKEIAEMHRIANQPIQDTPQFMTHKVFFPQGA
jgi:hypothetical protein